MGIRILKKITHYGIWQFALLGTVFYYAAPYLKELLMEYIQIDLIEIPEQFWTVLVYCLLGIIWGVIVFRYERNTLYADKTGGRDYIQDHVRSFLPRCVLKDPCFASILREMS